MRSKDSCAVDGQAGLALVRPQSPVDIPLDVIERQRNFLAALTLCVQSSGLEDKEVYLQLGIDAGHWSRIMKGEAHFPVNRLNDLCDICGNEAPLIWWARSRGYGLVMLKTEAERRIEELEAQLSKERERRQWAEDMAMRRGA